MSPIVHPSHRGNPSLRLVWIGVLIAVLALMGVLPNVWTVTVAAIMAIAYALWEYLSFRGV